ncbi:MAG: hypothetical protein WCK84_02605 [Bacteroidota bacterium]
MTNSESLKPLEELVKRYPYCQSGQLLYTFNLFKEENLQYPLQLKKAAAYAGDRKILRELIDSAKIKVPVSARLELPTINASHKNSGDNYAPAVEIIPELIDRVDSVKLAFKATYDRMTHEELISIVKKRIAEINADKKQGHLSLKSLHNPESDLQNVLSEESIPLSRNSKEAIIDKFILEEPKISKPKTAFFNLSDSAVRSNFDDEEIVSETLAKLYATQGNISKAVHVYQKLSLLNQEKSRYFAAQIENLKS